MSLFDEAIDTYVKGQTVRFAFLLKLDFASDVLRLWTGLGTITAGGETWQGTGNMGSITGVEESSNSKAGAVELSLSGADADILAIFRDEYEAEAKGRRATIYMQFFRGADDIPLDAPAVIWQGVMSQPSISLSADGTRSVSVTAESLFSQRRRPKYGLLTDADQKSRFAGDRGLEFITALTNKEVTWPKFSS